MAGGRGTEGGKKVPRWETVEALRSGLVPDVTGRQSRDCGQVAHGKWVMEKSRDGAASGFPS